MTQSLSDLQQRFLAIATDSNLSPKQKSNFLALEAEATIPYMTVSDEVSQAMQQGVICDMFEGHAPFKPRYVLPDYAKFLSQGSEYLELAPAEDFDDAINMLTILYHHVPSVTSIPVYLGQLDDVLMPYVGDLTDEQIYKKLKHFWIMLDRTLPDAFMHVNIGPTDNIICRTILKVDAELKQIAPNLTFMYDEAVTPDALLKQATQNICECSKPHIANYPMHANAYEGARFGIVSCYNSLPLAGGSNTLVRMNLKEAANRADNREDFFNNVLPEYHGLMVELMDARASHLHEKSEFFKGFLTQEGLIEESRFAPMYGIYGMAEAVNVLLEKEGRASRYGQDATANELGHAISAKLSELVESTPVKFGLEGKALLHAQGGISLDLDVTPGVRIPYGNEPDPVSYVQATAGHHQYYRSGISDILTIDETVKSNPEAMFNLCKGALNAGYREFTANVASNDLVRVTGYMVKLSDIAKFDAEGSRTNTTFLGAEAAKNTGILERSPRVVSHEMSPTYAK
ncbi:YjjI family glycine radical enzyme [Vibrio jasicida]|uniref:YjjI family glycine radical enzyme n=1 Tax=Vibrio TaxID=662 RepID=UPI0005F0B61F|nr:MULTISPECIES: YjjI family glycine radical enzyme [Vibrio]PMO45570.1 YjjI family glycine radical enzyme [Vibrio sp. 10N.222.52.B12]CAH1533409.1 YjjI family glycine radical enzyme [Vibrio jasicida]